MSKLPHDINKNLNFLQKLARTNSEKKRKQIFKEATSEQLLLLVEICYNIIKGYFPLTTKQKFRLIPYANFIRKLGRVRTEKGAKKIVQQRGGGVVSFAPLLIPIITEALRLVNGK